MNDAEKQIVVVKLNKLHGLLSERISIVNVEIGNQEVLIEESKKQLTQVTNDIVKNEEELNKLKSTNQSLQVELEGLENQIKNYINEIQESKREIDEAHRSINERKPKDDFWSNLNRGLKPFTGDIPGMFSSKIGEIESKIKNLDSEIHTKNQNLSGVQIKKGECDSNIAINGNQTKELREKRDNLENKLKELGKVKTQNSDFKLQLETLKTQCKLIIENIDTGKEVLEAGINPVVEIEEKIKTLYSSNGLTY
ncbi:hypothetical protein ACTA71_010469 [Dictyostelium dimigraforme]